MTDQKQKQNDEPLLNHEYDGIRELDNPLPRWWLLTFYGTIVFAVLYVGWLHFGNGPTIEADYKKDMYDLEGKVLVEKAKSGGDIDEQSLVKMVRDPGVVAEGKVAYSQKCASCHAPDGGGTIGPNLADQYWIHGDGKIGSIAKVIRDGVLDKGMPAWGSLMSGDELKKVTVFVASLKGSKPAAPKAPQGNEIK